MKQQIPDGFVEIGPAEHPRDGATGTLIRNRNTGVYCLLVGTAARSVPHKWAQDAAAEMGKGSDAIQDRCIEQMTKLGLNPNKVAEMLDGQVSRSHVCDYLTRRASIGSHKLQHLLGALNLEIAPK
jgi:hypothetical protein